jgi:hypothetical protein
MADTWYYSEHEDKLGPFSSAQLKELAAVGQLLPSHTVWKEGIEKGVLAARVKNLFRVLPAESPLASAVIQAASSNPPAQSSSLVSDPVSQAPSSTTTMESQGPTLQANIDEDQQSPKKKISSQSQPTAKRLFRVVASKGAVVLGQDGTSVRYKKKCPKCGFEDSSMRTMALRSGVNRDRFFCQKCRKLQQVEIHAAV